MQKKKITRLLKSKHLTPTERKIGDGIVIKLIDDYTFTIREHKHKPGYLCANLKKGDVLAEWNELNDESLPLAIDYAYQVTQAKRKRNFFKNSAVMWLISLIVFIALVGSAAYITSRVTNCNYEQSQL